MSLRKLKKSRRAFRIIPEMSDGVRACFQRPNSIIGDAFSCHVDGQTRYWRLPIDFLAVAMAA